MSLLGTINPTICTNMVAAQTITTTTGGTTTLTAANNQQQVFTGSSNQTVVLPVTSTLVLGQTFQIANNSTGLIIVQSSGANTITTITPTITAVLTCILTSGTTEASWSYRTITQTIQSVALSPMGTPATSARSTDTTVGVSYPNTAAFPANSRQQFTVPVGGIYLTQVEYGFSITSPGAITIRDNPSGITVLGTALINETDPGVVVTPSVSSSGGAGSSPSSSLVRRVTYPNIFLAAGTYQASMAFTGDARLAPASLPSNPVWPSGAYNFWLVVFGLTSPTTTLTSTSQQQQYFTGIISQSVVLPNASTLVPGFFFKLINRATNTVVIKSNDGTTIYTMPTLTWVFATCLVASGITPSSWSIELGGSVV
jgi:hypothetical protein